mmetsp:Transcript_9981/g.24705  ORF Transcript_9981/g.24705 Transcript_9981/m.24705 type:complete len:353 (+) Transcript_9981:175-1233(+)
MNATAPMHTERSSGVFDDLKYLEAHLRCCMIEHGSPSACHASRGKTLIVQLHRFSLLLLRLVLALFVKWSLFQYVSSVRFFRSHRLPPLLLRLPLEPRRLRHSLRPQRLELLVSQGLTRPPPLPLARLARLRLGYLTHLEHWTLVQRREPSGKVVVGSHGGADGREALLRLREAWLERERRDATRGRGELLEEQHRRRLRGGRRHSARQVEEQRALRRVDRDEAHAALLLRERGERLALSVEQPRAGAEHEDAPLLLEARLVELRRRAEREDFRLGRAEGPLGERRGRSDRVVARGDGQLEVGDGEDERTLGGRLELEALGGGLPARQRGAAVEQRGAELAVQLRLGAVEHV